jgi:hypothetical protein
MGQSIGPLSSVAEGKRCTQCYEFPSTFPFLGTSICSVVTSGRSGIGDRYGEAGPDFSCVGLQHVL